MKIILLLTMYFSSYADVTTKVTDTKQVKVIQSISIAQPGMEMEAYRIQHLFFQNKDTFMAAKLINGDLFLEKPITKAQFSNLNMAAGPVRSIESSDLCKTPINVVYVRDGKESKSKICGEKPQNTKYAETYTARVKEVLDIK